MKKVSQNIDTSVRDKCNKILKNNIEKETRYLVERNVFGFTWLNMFPTIIWNTMNSRDVIQQNIPTSLLNSSYNILKNI